MMSARKQRQYSRSDSWDRRSRTLRKGLRREYPEQSVPFLADALKPAVKLDAAKARRWIADLGDEEFAVREAASRELALWGENMEPELVAALADKSSPEA